VSEPSAPRTQRARTKPNQGASRNSNAERRGFQPVRGPTAPARLAAIQLRHRCESSRGEPRRLVLLSEDPRAENAELVADHHWQGHARMVERVACGRE